MARSIWIVNFKKYNPPRKVQHSENRGKKLSWVRCETNWFDDSAVLTMPEEMRWIWPAMFALAGESEPPGRIDMNKEEMALRFRVSEERVAGALEHLWRKGRIRYSRPVADGHPEGGEGVA